MSYAPIHTLEFPLKALEDEVMFSDETAGRFGRPEHPVKAILSFHGGDTQAVANLFGDQSILVTVKTETSTYKCWGHRISSFLKVIESGDTKREALRLFL